MPTQKWCSVNGCKNFTFTKLDDFEEIGWSAFQIPNGNGKVKCFCKNHQKEMNKEMIETIHEYNKTRMKIPICQHCGKQMKNYTPTKGKFKGQLQEYSWVCDCKDFPKHLVIGIG